MIDPRPESAGKPGSRPPPRSAPGLVLALALGVVWTLGACDKSEEMRLRREVTELRGELSDAKQRAQDISVRMQRIRARNKVLIGLVEGLTAEPERAAKNESGGVASAHRALEALDRDIELLATTLKQSRQDMEQLRSQRKALQTNLNEAMRTIEEGKEREAQAQDRLSTYRQMLLKLRSMIESEKLELQIVRNRMVVKLPEALLFDSGKARIKKEGQEALADLAQVLVGIEGREFEIAGHTDDVPIRNWRFKSNWDLAASRAVNVTRFLVEQGVPRSRLSAAAYADTRPVSQDTTDEARALNRRIEVVMLPKLDELPDLTALDKPEEATAPEPDDGGAAAARAEAESEAAPSANGEAAEPGGAAPDATTDASEAKEPKAPATEAKEPKNPGSEAEDPAGAGGGAPSTDEGAAGKTTSEPEPKRPPQSAGKPGAPAAKPAPEAKPETKAPADSGAPAAP